MPLRCGGDVCGYVGCAHLSAAPFLPARDHRRRKMVNRLEIAGPERGTLARERKNGEWGAANAKRHSNSLNSCLTSGPHVRMDALSRSNVREGSCSRVGNRLYQRVLLQPAVTKSLPKFIKN
jgi:hypothetical protein